MSKAISVGHDVRGVEKLIPTHEPFHQCHALLNYHQPVSGAICKWPLPNPDGEKKSIGPHLDRRNINEHLTTQSG